MDAIAKVIESYVNEGGAGSGNRGHGGRKGQRGGSAPGGMGGVGGTDLSKMKTDASDVFKYGDTDEVKWLSSRAIGSVSGGHRDGGKRVQYGDVKSVPGVRVAMYNTPEGKFVGKVFSTHRYSREHFIPGPFKSADQAYDAIETWLKNSSPEWLKTYAETGAGAGRHYSGMK